VNCCLPDGLLAGVKQAGSSPTHIPGNNSRKHSRGFIPCLAVHPTVTETASCVGRDHSRRIRTGQEKTANRDSRIASTGHHCRLAYENRKRMTDIAQP
jgi:hypothetical protein